GEDSSIYRSTDGGDSWTEITRNPGLPTGVLGKIGVAISPAKAGRVWALIEADDGALFRSDDNGETWERVCDQGDLRRRAWYYIHIVADPSDENTVWVLNLKCWKSIDGGKTFTAIPTPHGDNQDLWIDPTDSNRMIEGNDGGANVTFNGGRSWSSIYNQPTAQFYHVTTDDRTPYTIFGSQQDNTALGGPSSSARGAITLNEWFQPGGGESGYIAIKPTDDNIIYGGAIGSGAGNGRLLRFDRRTKQSSIVTVWPEVTGMGRGAEALKYRFQWTFPISFSPHEENTLYVTSNVVHRSTDDGMTWEVISPDLSHNDPETLKPSGGPITRDNTGAEAYGTIFAFVESPHERGFFWAGTDDGRLHTSEGGKEWSEVSIPGLERALISIIEVSPHDAATAYVAATRYKHDDFAPYLYKTTDYGKSWTRITNGIPENDFTRTIREDPNQKGLLYAGTETGLYISFDDGENWQPFQSNLPVCPIHDVIVKGTDLIAATHGRSFWVLDDLTPLYQISAGLASEPAAVLAPRTVKRFRHEGRPGDPGPSGFKSYGRFGGMMGTSYQRTNEYGENVITFLDAGKNPPDGAVIHYWLKDTPKGKVTLTIRDGKGNLIRRFESKTDTTQQAETEPVTGEGYEGQTSGEDAPAESLKLPADAGMNRFVWNLRYANAKPAKGVDMAADALLGPIAVPGKYTAELAVDGKTYSSEITIEADPRVGASAKDLQAQFDLLMQIRDKQSETHVAITTIRTIKEQLDGWSARATDAGQKEQATALRDKLVAIEEVLVQPKASDPRQFPNGLNDKLAALPGMISNADTRPANQYTEVFKKLSGEVDEQLSKLKDVLSKDVKAFNDAVRSADVVAVG
ncbi:MAG TPA: glycosyl hydrolase, partial [Thermomicrobiales bacterium]|nr:glycosyl hydrolase [Thermomicrobiales bacterium]